VVEGVHREDGEGSVLEGEVVEVEVAGSREVVVDLEEEGLLEDSREGGDEHLT